MSKNIFVSFKYEEKNWRDNVLQMFQALGGKSQATPVWLDPNQVKKTTAEIHAAIADKLGTCRGVLLVLGNKCESRWIEHEMQVAKQKGLSIRAARHPLASGPVPRSLPSIELVEWKQDDIARWIETL